MVKKICRSISKAKATMYQLYTNGYMLKAGNKRELLSTTDLPPPRASS